MSSSFDALFLEVLRDPPDKNEPQPIGNRRETIFGVVITFMVHTIQLQLSVQSNNQSRSYRGWPY
jgi:hypothetical protein